MIVIRLTLLPVIATLVTACASDVSTGTQNIAAARIQRGVTTEADLIDQLGPPQGRGLDSKGRKMLTWNRMDVTGKGKAWIPVVGPFLSGAADVRKEQLAVSFDSHDRVVDARRVNEQHEASIFGETDQ